MASVAVNPPGLRFPKCQHVRDGPSRIGTPTLELPFKVAPASRTAPVRRAKIRQSNIEPAQAFGT